MGSGKSTTGRVLAALLSWSFVDLDCEIERAEGRILREIFSQDGEAQFREIETAALRSILAGMQSPTVLASGGGTCVQARNAELLRTAGATVIFLDASAETLLQRCSSEAAGSMDEIRPLARDRESFLRLYEERLPLYRAANLTVVCETKQPQEVAREIAEQLGLLKT